MTIALITVGLLVGLFVGGAILIYNRLVRLRNGVEGAWSGIEVELNRRGELVPNLVQTVKGYAAHEKSTLEAVVAARQAGAAAQGHEATAQAADGLAGALRQVFALAENYPELKADASFRQLQQDLEETENRIAFSRQYYNESVRKYDNARLVFPSNIVAARMGFGDKEYFWPDDPGARDPSRVEFS